MNGFEQVCNNVRSDSDLEDFMKYYEIDESDKCSIRQQWQAERGINGDVQDRGVGKALVGGGVGLLLLLLLLGRRGRCKPKSVAWQPGMGQAQEMAKGGYGMQSGYGGGAYLNNAPAVQSQFVPQQSQNQFGGYNDIGQGQGPSRNGSMRSMLSNAFSGVLGNRHRQSA